MDAKSKVKVGEFSRGGKSRGSEASQACDHDMQAECILVPFGILEQHGNGAILNSLETVLEWAKTMTWKGISPMIRWLKEVYPKGVRVSRTAMRPIEARLRRSQTLPRWSVEIFPLIYSPT